MIPTQDQAKALWDKYKLPQPKRTHAALVAKVAMFLASKINEPINKPLLLACALTHDIDKAIPKLPGERHPDTGVRVLREEGMGEIADVVETHSLHTILDDSIGPKTWEQKLLFLADKMVKQEVIGVDARFKLWNDEHLPQEAQAQIDAAYPKVKELENEVFTKININPNDIRKYIV